jgi:hypothetical protein
MYLSSSSLPTRVVKSDRNSAFFLLSALLGWFIGSYSILNTRDKRYKHIAILLFILVTAAILAMLVGIFAGSITFSTSLVNLPINNEARSTIACFIDRSRTCTRCELEGDDRCPEWTKEDVTRILQTQAKGSATLASIFLVYAAAALRFGFSMRRNIMLYQIDYV